MPKLNRRAVLAGTAATLAAPRIAGAADAATLRVVPQADLALLDPGITTATVTRNHAMMVFDQLYGLDADGNPVPGMAAGATAEDGGKRWTVKLREGLKFHDGEKVLASDCAASLRRWAVRDAFGKTLMAAVDELSAPDDTSLVFRLKHPFPLLPEALAKAVPYAPFMMPARVIPADPGKQVTEMVGSGPFRFVAAERVPGAQVVYAKNAAYVPSPNGKPGLSGGPKVVNFDRVEWKVIPDAATALAAIRQGEVDWWERPVPDLIPAARADQNLRVEITNTTGTIAFLRFNSLNPPFNNPDIRRLVQSAIDQKEFAQAIAGSDPSLQGGKVGIFLPGAPMASLAGIEALAGRKDYAKLKQELTAAGYKGEPVVMLVGTDSPVNNAVSEVIADILRKMGFAVDYRAMDWGSVVQRRTNKEPVEKGGWCLFAVSADGDYFADPTVAPAIRANGLQAWPGWPTSEKIEALYKAWFEAPDLKARQDISRQLQLQTFIDVPYVNVAQVFIPSVFRKEITGVLPGFVKFWNVRRG